MSTVEQLSRETVVDAVRRLVVAESRQPIDPATVPEKERLDGKLLRMSSIDVVWLLVRLEDDLVVRLPNDIFVGRRFRTVADFADAVLDGAQAR